MYIDRDERTAARRAEWLGRLAVALADAQRAVQAMMGTAANAPALSDLHSQITTLRTKLELHRRGPGAYLFAPDDEHWLAHLSGRILPPVHDQVP
jgi:hypothetical protein